MAPGTVARSAKPAVEEVALRSMTKLVWPWYPAFQPSRISVGPSAAAARATGGSGNHVTAVAGADGAEVPKE